MLRPAVWEKETNGPVVHSLMEIREQEEPVRSQFEVMVRHLYDRLLNNDVFGEDAAARLAQLSYGIALPTVLVALFLSPAYHPPHPLVRGYWSQACDHLFFVTYAFVIMGCAVIFQWEMLFPDALDVSVMATLPIPLRRLLLGRVTAMTMSLALVHVGTSGLGCLFLPAVADQRCGFFRQVLAQTTAVSMAGACIVASLITTQALLVCLPRGRFAETMRPFVRVVVLTVMLTVLFLFPLTSQYLPVLLRTGGAAGFSRSFPPFWFLGVYECVMWGARAPLVFHALARTAVVVTSAFVAASVGLYPLGYVRRVRQLIEGPSMQTTGWEPGRPQGVIDRVLLRRPKTRATAHFAAQTLRRIERLHLYLAMYAGVGVALVLSCVLGLRIESAAVKVTFSVNGLRMALPVAVFWTVAGMKTALLSPVGRRGNWIFQVIGGRPDEDELRGGRVLATYAAMIATILVVGILDTFASTGVLRVRVIVAQAVFVPGLSLIVSELFFAGVRTVPFTGAERRGTYELPFTFVRYFVIFPAFALSMATALSWVERSAQHIAVGAVALGAAYWLARCFRIWRGTLPGWREELTVIGLNPE